MPNCLRGMAPAEALERLLRRRGVEGPLRDLHDSLGSRPNSETIAIELRQRGFWAREARVHCRDLSRVEVPTMLRLKDKCWILLLQNGEKSWHVESADGEGFISSDAIEAAADGRVIDITRALPRAKSLWGILPSLVLGQRRSLWQIGLMSLGLQLLALLSPQFTRLAMDRVLPEGASSLLILVTLGMILTSIFQAWVGWLRQHIILFLGSRMESLLSQGFLFHLLSLPFPVLARKPLGELLQAHTALDSARELFTERMLSTLLDGSLALLYLVVMLSSMPGPTAMVVLVSGFMAVITVIVGRYQADLRRAELQAQAREQGYLVELIKGIATIKTAGGEKSSLHHWQRLLSKVLGLSLRRQRYGLWSEVGMEGIRHGLTAVILVWGGKLVLDGQVKIGSLMAFVQMSSAFLMAVLSFAQAYLSFMTLSPQVERVNEILTVNPAPSIPYSKSFGADDPVIFDNVWFRYDRELPWIFRGYSLQVNAGEKCWLQAPSGFGKSTLLRLLAGLYIPEKGRISVGGLKPEEVRDQLLYLPQFVQLYGGTIQENLRILSGGAARDKIMAACETSGLEAFVSKLPMGYDTVLPQGGGNLSGGQRQLIAITAVMASDRRLILLDEAMANIDSLSRSRIQQSSWFENRTIIYASHDVKFG